MARGRSSKSSVPVHRDQRGDQRGTARHRPGTDLEARLRELLAEPDQGVTAGELVRARSSALCPTPLQQEVERSARIRGRARARQLPYLATAATSAAGYAATGVGELAAGTGGAIACTTCAAALCLAALGTLRVRYRAGITDQWRRRWWAAGGAAAGWVTTAAAVGADNWIMTAALAVGAAAAGAPWLREHHIPDPDPAQPPAAPPDLTPANAAIYEQRWAENVARVGGVVPGAELTDREVLPRAIRWTVQTPPGSTTFDSVFAQRARIAAGLRVPTRALLLDPSDDDESHLVLTVITRDLLAAGVPYTGPRYQAGRIAVGDFADGTGAAEYIAYDEVGCRSGLATGEPGSGKSAFLEAVALALRSSGEWQVWFGDGDPEGGSSPLLNEIADWPEAGAEHVLAQLAGVEATIKIRSLFKGTLTAGPDGTPMPITDPATQRPVRELRPSPAYNGICWILDELHRLTSDEWLKKRNFVKRLERVVRIGRKYGVVVLAGTQSLLVPDYGNSTSLRAMLAARNLFAFRNGNKSEKAVVNGLPISPGVLPPGGGYAFAAGSGRLAMLRVAWSARMADWAEGLPATSLDSDTALAVAALRPTAPRDAAADFAERVARLDRWRSEQGAATDGAGHDSRKQDDFPTPSMAGRVVPAALTAANVVPLRRPSTPDSPPASIPDGDTGADLDLLNGTQLAVYRALIDGHERSGEIVAHTSLKPPAVSKALAALADLGFARRLEHGWWRAVPATKDSTG